MLFSLYLSLLYLMSLGGNSASVFDALAARNRFLNHLCSLTPFNGHRDVAAFLLQQGHHHDGGSGGSSDGGSSTTSWQVAASGASTLTCLAASFTSPSDADEDELRKSTLQVSPQLLRYLDTHPEDTTRLASHLETTLVEKSDPDDDDVVIHEAFVWMPIQHPRVVVERHGPSALQQHILLMVRKRFVCDAGVTDAQAVSHIEEAKAKFFHVHLAELSPIASMLTFMPRADLLPVAKGSFSSYLETRLYSSVVEPRLPRDGLAVASEAVCDVVERITVLFQQMLLKRRPVDHKEEDFWDRGGRVLFQRAVSRYVFVKQRILFVLPAFPFKSSNQRTKVLGKVPDQGEYVALRRLEEFLQRIRDIYPHGGHLLIFSDGRVYCDIFRISDDDTDLFKNKVRTMFSSEQLSWSDLDVFFPGLNNDQTRVALEGIFGTTPEEVEHRIHDDPDFMEVYRGFKKFIGEEFQWFQDDATVAQKRADATKAARRLMLRNWAYGAFVKLLFPFHVRLSIHPSSNQAKFSVNMVGRTDWGTPWHNCAVLGRDGKWSLAHREDCERAGYQLTTSAEGYPYFAVIDPNAPSVPDN